MNCYTNNYGGKGCCQPDECGTYVTIEQGPQGEIGPQGVQGDRGCPGPQGENGETPVITVLESTPISYKLNFKTFEQDITTPNLFAPYSEYHADLSAVNSVLTIPLKNLVLTYQTTSASAVRISIAPKESGASVLIDMRRTSIYNASTIETQTLDNTTVSGRTVIDEIVYSKSQETHNVRIRQQDPETKLWSFARSCPLFQTAPHVPRFAYSGANMT